MKVLAKGETPPPLSLKAKDGTPLELKKGPVVVVFFHPDVLASRHVVGYLRRLPGIAPGVPIWFISTASPEETEVYTSGYLDDFPVAVEGGCAALKSWQGGFVPTTYLLNDGKVEVAFTGFHKRALNTLAARAAELVGKRPKELVTEMDNKGEYELAEPAPC